jgi:GH15 family glucan-1,4-alpha-glucosidase
VPDPGIQAQLDSSIRNIYQAREIKKGLPAFQVGPTCYRGLWVVDGSFLMEAVAYLGRVEEARNGIRYLLSFQRPDGAIMLIDGHLKETGIALWAVTRHARLTGDKEWLAEVWPQIEKGFAYIRTMRDQASADAKSPNYRLLPEGFSDGGLGGKNPEYTNVYWTLAGLKAAVEAARWLGKSDQAGDWQKEYDDFYAAFRRAADRDARTDAHGNRYVPISMRKDAKISPQKAQWAFLHAVFPGKVFAPDDPLVLGNMAMLRAAEAEGLVRDTGWVANGVWNYFASFYAHGWLWLGQGRKAGQTLYDFANHASPLLVWREEQMPAGEGDAVCGDMPHNWASAEFIRLVRDLLILERGAELHLFEGLPPAWIRPGKVIRVRSAVTEFGPMSLEFRVTADGSKAILTLDPPQRNRPKRIVVHQSAWSGTPETVELSPQGHVEQEIRLKK